MIVPVIVALALTGFPATSQNSGKPDANLPPAVLISRDPGGPKIAMLPVRIDGDATASTVPLYLKNTGNADLADLRFFAQLTDDAGQMVTGPSVTLQVQGPAAAPDGVSLAAGKEVPATLQLAQFTEIGKYSGWLLLEHAGTTTRLAALSLERYPLPKLRLVGAAENAGINLTRKVAAFRHTFWIESTNRAPVKSLQILVSPLIGPDGAQVETSWTIGGRPGSSAPVPLEGLGTLDLEVTAVLALAGTYGGSVTLIYSNRRETTALSITRSRPQPSVEILGGETVAATTCWRWNSPSVRMTVHETAGQPVQLDLPALLTLTRKGKNQEKFQASYSAVFVTDPSDEPVPGPLSLAALATARFKLHLERLDTAGEYNGTIRVSAKDAQPLDQPFTILLKEWCVTPLVLISLGVGVSFGLRLWLKQIKPQLEQEITLQTLDEQLQGFSSAPPGLDVDELAVVAVLRERIDDLYNRLADGPVQNAPALLTDIGEKTRAVPNWVNARRRVAVIKSTRARAGLEARLRIIRDYLTSPDRNETTLNDSNSYLSNISGAIDTAVKNDLLARIDALKINLDAQRPLLNPANQLRLDGEIVPLKDRAETEAKRMNLEQAGKLFDRARGLYASLLADDLIAGLDPALPPRGFLDADWRALVESLRARVGRVADASLSDPDSAVSQYNAAYSLLLRSLAEHLSTEISDTKASLVTTRWRGPSRLREFSDRLDSLEGELRAAMRQAGDLQFHAAGKAYTAVVQKFETLLSDLHTASVTPAAALGATPAANLQRPPVAATIPASLSMAALPPLLAQAAAARPTARALRFQKKLFSGIANGVILLVAVASGIQLLWVNNPTWGGWDDMFTALMWGLGLHQVAGTGLDLTGLAEKFTG